MLPNIEPITSIPQKAHDTNDSKTDASIPQSSLPLIENGLNKPKTAKEVPKNRPKPANAPTLPIFRLANDSTRTTARYSVKNRAQFSKRALHDEKRKTQLFFLERRKSTKAVVKNPIVSKNEEEFIVGSSRPLKSKFGKNSQMKIEQKKPFRRKEDKVKKISSDIDDVVQNTLPLLTDVKPVVCHEEDLGKEEPGTESQQNEVS